MPTRDDDRSGEPHELRSQLEAERERAARAVAIQGKAVQAYERLLELAEQRDSGQIRRVARFLAATYNGEIFPLDPFELRTVDIAISDDMLFCLDALRWGKADLHGLVPDGERRVLAVLQQWGMEWPEGQM